MDKFFEFAYLAECNPGEMVRAKTEAGVQWMIVGKRTNFFLPMLFLSGDGVPTTKSVLNNSSDFYDRAFETYRVMNFGADYKVVPSLADESEVGEGPLFTSPGTLIILDDRLWSALATTRGSGFIISARGTLSRESRRAIARHSRNGASISKVHSSLVSMSGC
jgi:hypothetical protein